MNIRFGNWTLKPYKSHGARCWQLYHGKSTSPMKYPATVGDALAMCAEHDMRNVVEGDYDLAAALAEYERITEAFVREAKGLQDAALS